MKQIGVHFTFLVVVFCLMAIGLNWTFADIGDELGKSLMEDPIDVWDAFLGTLNHLGLSDPHWEIEAKVQEKLIIYFKAKIDVGVSDGLTALPPLLPRYVHRFPEEMLQELRSYAKSVLETDPNNGAAAKFLAIEAFREVDTQKPIKKYPLLEKAMVLVPNDVEICFFAFAMCTRLGNQMNEKALVSLERLFERLRETSYPIPYRWVQNLYSLDWNSATPSEVYERIDANDPLIGRWKAVLNQIPTIFEREWVQKPDSYIFYIVAYIHETLGNDEASRAVFKRVQPVFEKRLEENPNDSAALGALASIHEKFGNPELAREYKVRANPTLAFKGKVLPDFSSVVDLNGEPISLTDYRGKVVLLDFWAVWCVPCVAEMPNIRAVYKKYHSKGFEVIGVSFDRDETVLREFIKENQLPWRQIFAGEKQSSPVAQKYRIRGIPAQFLISRDGKVISVDARGSRLDKLVAVEIEREMD